MLKPFLTSLVLGLAAAPAAAFEIESMSETERDVFRSEIRDYLLENPEVLMEAIAILEERRAAEAVAQDELVLQEFQTAIFEDGYSWVGGNPDGDVTIVEFLDYRCGFCKRAHPEVQQLLESDGDIKLIVKEFPILGAESEAASRFAIATKILFGDDAYLAVHDALMAWEGGVNAGALGRIARDVGISEAEDVQAIFAEMDSDTVSEMIAANRALAQALQIQGTPSFIMGNEFVRGYVDLTQMQSIVESIRAEQG